MKHETRSTNNTKKNRHQLMMLLDQIIVDQHLRTQLDEHPIETLKKYGVELPEEEQIALYDKRLSEILMMREAVGSARANTVTDVVSDVVCDVYETVTSSVATDTEPYPRAKTTPDSDVLSGKE